VKIIKFGSNYVFSKILPVYNWFFPLDNKEIVKSNEILKIFKEIKTNNIKTRALYFHIPFCNSICTFCSFLKSG